jgi:hypothetical protein
MSIVVSHCHAGDEYVKKETEKITKDADIQSPIARVLQNNKVTVTRYLDIYRNDAPY